MVRIKLLSHIIHSALIALTMMIVVSCENDLSKKPVLVTEVQLDKSEITLILIGDTGKLTATVLPENATNKKVAWTSDDENVVVVDSLGTVTAKGQGQCKVTVTTDDFGYTASCQVTVPEQPPVVIDVTGVTLEQTELMLNIGETRQLSAVVEPENATNKNVTWSTLDYKIATVDKNGVVKANAQGETLVCVTTVSGAIKECCKIVVSAPVTGVSFRLSAVEVIAGETQILTATVFPLDAIDRNVTWSSHNPDVAEVDNNGMVYAKAVGNALIEVTTVKGEKKATISVKVVPVPPQTGGFVKTYGTKFICDRKEIVFNGMGFYHSNGYGPPVSSFSAENYAKMASVGFNTIRLYVSAANFENSAESATPYREEMFSWLNNHIAWAKQNDLKIILAMIHSPLATSISDRALFTDINRQVRLAAVWKEIAGRYKDETTIAGFDLTNEPTVKVYNPDNAPYDCNGTPYLDHYVHYQKIIQSIVDAIREVDMNHIIITERLWLDGGHYSFAQHDQRDCWQNVDGKFNFPDIYDPAGNYAYTYHCYEPNTYTHQPVTSTNIYPSNSIGRYNEGPAGIPPWRYCKEYLDYAFTVPLEYIWNVKNVPAFIGETGIFTTNFDNNKGGAQWFEDVYDLLLDRYRISVNFHPYYIHEITTNFDPRFEAAFRKAFGTDN